MRKLINIKNGGMSEAIIVTGLVVCGMLAAPRVTITAMLAYQLGKVRSSNPNNEDEQINEKEKTS